MPAEYLKQSLIHLLNIQSFSKEETKVQEFVIEHLVKFGFKVQMDNIGNVYATRGETESYPLLNAHMDSVKGSFGQSKIFRSYYDNCRDCGYSDAGTKPFCYIKNEVVKYLTAQNCPKYIHFDDYEKQYGYKVGGEEEEQEEEVKLFELYYNSKTKQITSNKVRPMGGDDKCGIAIALDIAKSTDIPMKILFTVQEEIGCVGSEYAMKAYPTFFDDCAYGITIDRRGGNHICVTTGSERNANNYFIAELAKWAVISGIMPAFERGLMSDNYNLKYLVPNFINVSGGYYDAHRDSEYIKYDEVKLIRTWIKNFILKSDFE
jgi:hypothetical protein